MYQNDGMLYQTRLDLATYKGRFPLKQTDSVTFSPQANCTGWLSGSRWSPKLVPNFVGKGVSRVQRDGSPRQTGAATSHWNSFSVTHTRLSGPRLRTQILRKSDSAENRTRDIWISSQDLWPLDYRGSLHSPLSNLISTLTIMCILPSSHWKHFAKYSVSRTEEFRPLGCDDVWLLKNWRFGGTYRLHHQCEKFQ
jgi:hypothetical protein